jgi:hypothetical protein
MSDSILQKYAARNGEPGPDGAGSEGDASEDLGAFGWLRGLRDRSIMLELRRKSGNVTAIGYGWIERIDFDPSEGITLHALGQKFRIKGRNLNTEVRPTIRLFEGICRHRVPWIRESDDAGKIAKGKNETVVEAIEG